jgi:predicted amidohydrolase
MWFPRFAPWIRSIADPVVNTIQCGRDDRRPETFLCRIIRVEFERVGSQRFESMLEQVRVAAASIDSHPGRIEENLARISTWAQRAAGEGAKLILFPELSLTGFIPNHPLGSHDEWLRKALREARRAAVPLDGSPIQTLTKLAARDEILLSVGMLEDAGNRLFNTQLLVGPEGVLGYWRKLHIPMFEMPFYNGGSSAEVAETPLGRIGANICFDVLIPESTRLLAVQNVEIVLTPFAADPPPATPAGWANWASTSLKARAMENGVFVVACNYVGDVECAGVKQSFPGGGMILSPRGESLAEWKAESGQCGMILADLRADDLAAARAEPEYLYRFRRPELYGPLSRH